VEPLRFFPEKRQGNSTIERKPDHCKEKKEGYCGKGEKEHMMEESVPLPGRAG